MKRETEQGTYNTQSMQGMQGVTHRGAVMQVLSACLQAVDPYRAVRDALASGQVAHLLDDAARIYVVGAGKAGAAMARAVEDTLRGAIAGGLVVVKEGYKGVTGTGNNKVPLERIHIVEAGHPVPDRRGVEAARRLLAIADGAGEGDLVICLISGGGSALLAAPVEGVTLEDLQTTTQLLLRAGATIGELNAVRKHLSQLAGGQLARTAAPAHVLSLILSDVVGSPLDVIASGPTAPDPTTFADALAVLQRYGLTQQVPSAVLRWLHAGASGASSVAETPKPGDPVFANVTNLVVASNVTAVEAAATCACDMGLSTLIASTYLEGEAREVGRVLAAMAKEVATYARPVKRPGCVLFGGETTVTVRGNGIGGRNSELALGAALALDGWGPDLVVASLATDGGDGTSPGAGAVADGTTISRARAQGLDAYAALAHNDSYTFWAQLGDAIITGPTGTNVNDVMAIFVF